jgi:endonuclease YncB( thermonuclease family)
MPVPWVPHVTITRIVDGDTFRADLDRGWGDWEHDQKKGPIGSFRIYGINAPERRGATKAAGDAAMEYLATLLIVGQSYPVWSYAVNWTDDFGRTLADVVLPSGDLVSEAMIRAGHAKEKHYA